MANHPGSPAAGVAAAAEAAREPDLTVSLGPLTVRNPVWVAAGCFHYGREVAHVLPLDRLGAVCTKGTAPEPWPGNPGVRVAETACGMLNTIGLENPGVEHYLREEGPWLRSQGATIVVNVVGRSVEEYVRVVERLTPEVADAVELNISCPNVKEGGLAFGTSVEQTFQLTLAVRRATSLPLFVKLSPNVTRVVDFARAVEDAGADGVTLINALLGMAIDVRRCRPVLGTVFGGLSGPAIKPVALRMVWEVAGAVRIPVVGIGGIATAQDALEFLMAGASAVQIGSALFSNPLAPLEVLDGIRAYLKERGMARVTELVGAARSAMEAELQAAGGSRLRPGGQGGQG